MKLSEAEQSDERMICTDCGTIFLRRQLSDGRCGCGSGRVTTLAMCRAALEQEQKP